MSNGAQQRFAAVVLALAALIVLPQNGRASESATKQRSTRLPLQKEAPAAELHPVGEYRESGRIVRLRIAAAAAFTRLQEAARTNGVEIVPISGFRGWSYQEYLYRKAVKKYGRRQRWVAPPGYSPHHSGRAIDLGDGAARHCDVQQCFGKTRAYKWLMANGHRFGFRVMVSASQPGKITEPWHWYYIEALVMGERLAAPGTPASLSGNLQTE